MSAHSALDRTEPDQSLQPTLEILLCRKMQLWALNEVDRNNNQRAICIGDWFAEEFLIYERELPIL
jgi:hypothetical protein